MYVAKTCNVPKAFCHLWPKHIAIHIADHHTVAADMWQPAYCSKPLPYVKYTRAENNQIHEMQGGTGLTKL